MSSRRKLTKNILNPRLYPTNSDLNNGFGHRINQSIGSFYQQESNEILLPENFSSFGSVKPENNFEEAASSTSEISAAESTEDAHLSNYYQRESKRPRPADEPVALTPFYRQDDGPGATFVVDDNVWKTEPASEEYPRFDSAFDVPGYESDMLSCFGNSQLSEPVDFWRLFCTEDWLSKICQYTNNAGREQYGDKWQDVDNVELEALFGIWYMTGLLGMADISVNTLFSTTPFCGSFYAPLTFPRIRYQQLSSMLRFDDGHRLGGEPVDQLASIREIFDTLVANFKCLSVIGKNVCIGRVNLNVDGACEISPQISSKKHKNAICIRCVNDANTLFLHNAEICLSDVTDVKAEENEDDRASLRILRLTENLHLCGRLIVCEPEVTSLHLADQLYARMTHVLGPVSGARCAGLPETFVRDRKSSPDDGPYQFLFSNHRTLLKFRSNGRTEPTLLLSTAYNVPMCLGSKPVMICDYESYKSAVVNFNKLLQRYSCRQAGRRWPIRVLYWLLDAAAYNANCLYEAAKNPLRSSHIDYKSAAARREFLSKLAFSLIEAQIKRRDALATLPMNWYFKATKEVLDKMQFIAQKCSRIGVNLADQQQMPNPVDAKEFLAVDQSEGPSHSVALPLVGQPTNPALPYWQHQPFDNSTALYEEVMKSMPIKGRRCVYCDRKKDRKTRNICRACGKPVCTSHSRCDKMFVCIPCYQP